MSIWQQELTDDTWLVGVSGRLDQHQTPDLESLFDSILLEERGPRLIVDLSEVTYINSGGLRCLVTAWRRARREGGDVALTGLKSRVQEVFSMVGFDKVFTIYPSRKSALQAWQEQE
jgi:anti-sigma B factor antagonist